MAQYAFHFDGTRCSSCKTCQMACKDYYDLDLGINYRKVYEVTFGDTTRDEGGCVSTSCVSYMLSMSCNHCDDPACAQVCPTGAMRKDADTGIVSVDTGKCIGCGYCHMACPYNAPKVNRERGYSDKCNACAERVAEGKMPICVESCPTRALAFGTVEEMSKLGERGSIAPLPDPSFTQPNLFIKASADAVPVNDPRAFVENPLEVM